MSYRAGSAYVSVRPDMSGFSDDVAAGLDAQFAEAGASAGEAFSAAFDGAAHTDAASPEVTITAEADTAEARADLDEAAMPRTAEILLDDGDLAAKVAEDDSLVDDLGRPRELQLGLDDEDVTAEAEELQALLDDLARPREATVGLDDADLKAKAAEDDAALDDVARPREAKVDAGGLAAVSPLILAIAAGLVTVGPELLGAAAGVGLLGAAFVSAASVGGGFTGVLDTLKSDLMSGAEQVGGFSSALGQTGVASLQDFEGAAGDVGQALGQLFVDFAPEIQDAAKDVEELAQDFDDWAKSVSASGLDDFLSKTFDPQTISELKGDLGDIVQILKNVGGAIEDISPTALAALSAGLGVLKDIPPGVIAGLIDLFAAMKAASLVMSVGTGIGNMISGLQDMFGSGDTEEAATAGKAAGDAFASGVDEGAATVDEGVATAMGGLGEATAEEANAAGDESGASFAGGFGEGAAGMGAGLGELVADASLGALFAAAAAGFAIGAAVGAGFTAGLGAAGAGGLGAKLEGEVQSAGSGASSWLQPAGADAVQGFADGFDSGEGTIAGEGGKITEALTSGLSGAGGALEKEGESAAQGFMDGLERGFGAGLAGIGVNVVEGLISGIEQEGQDLLDAAESIADSVVNTLESALDIASPSKRTHQIGEYAALGFAYGLTDTLGDVEHAAGSLASTSLGALSGMAAAQSLGSLGAPSSLPGVSGPVGASALQLQVTSVATSDPLMNEIVSGLRFKISGMTGGDVQAAIGQGPVRT